MMAESTLPKPVRAAHEVVLQRQQVRADAWRNSPALIAVSAVVWADALEDLRKARRYGYAKNS